MSICRAVLLAFMLHGFTPAQESISFPTVDGGTVYANVYGRGDCGVVLAHGGRSNKESWDKQAQIVAAAGFRVLAFDFRGHGRSRGPANGNSGEGRRFDVLASVNYLRKMGAVSVSVIGASMGGDYAAEAAEAEPGLIDRLVLLAAGAYTPLERAKSRKLFIMSRDDVIGDNKPRMPAIRDQYERASGPKEFVVLEGTAHAQVLFQTDQGDRVMREILRFLSAP
jgi:pimeloyl-ACP methyl ester carboxylesterase